MPRVAPMSKTSLAEVRVVDHAAQVIAALVEAGQRRHLEALIGADEQLGRPDGRLDGAEPQPLGLARRAAELARRIDLDLDAVVGRLLQLGLVDLDVFMLHVVEGLGRELHGEFLRPRRRRRDDETGSNREGRGDMARDLPAPVGSAMLDSHAIPPSRPIQACAQLMLIVSVEPIQPPTLSRRPRAERSEPQPEGWSWSDRPRTCALMGDRP